MLRLSSFVFSHESKRSTCHSWDNSHATTILLLFYRKRAIRHIHNNGEVHCLVLFIFIFLFIYLFYFFFLLFCLAEWRCATCTRMDDNKGIAGAAHFHFTTSLKEPWLSESRCSSSSSSFFFIGPNSLCPPLPANKFDGPHRARITVMTLGLQHLSSYVYTNHLP